MRALCVLVGSVVILAVIQAGSLFVDAKKTHQGHHKALKVTARTESITEGSQEQDSEHRWQVARKPAALTPAQPVVGRSDNIRPGRNSLKARTRQHEDYGTHREAHGHHGGEDQEVSRENGSSRSGKKTYRFCAENPDACHRKNEAERKERRQHRIKKKKQVRQEEENNSTAIASSAKIAKTDKKIAALKQSLAQFVNDGNTTLTKDGMGNRKGKDHHHGKTHKKHNGAKLHPLKSEHHQNKRYMKTHGKRKPANRMQIVQNRKIKLANRRKYKKQQEAKHQKNCNKSKGCTPDSTVEDSTCSGKRGENRRCLDSCQCRPGLKCVMVSSEYPAKKKYPRKHKPYGQCAKDVPVTESAYVTELAPMSTTVMTVVDN